MIAPGLNPADGRVAATVPAVPTAEPEAYLTPDEAGARLRASGRSARAWAQHGCKVAGRVVVLPSVLRGTRRLFTASGCDKFLRDCTEAREQADREQRAATRQAEAADAMAEARAELRRPVGC